MVLFILNVAYRISYTLAVPVFALLPTVVQLNTILLLVTLPVAKVFTVDGAIISCSLHLSDLHRQDNHLPRHGLLFYDYLVNSRKCSMNMKGLLIS